MSLMDFPGARTGGCNKMGGTMQVEAKQCYSFKIKVQINVSTKNTLGIHKYIILWMNFILHYIDFNTI